MALIEERDHVVKSKEWRRGRLETEKRTPYVRVVLEILTGPNAGLTTEWMGWLTKAAAKATSDQLMALGWTGLDFKSLPGMGSRRAIAVVEHERSASGRVFAKCVRVRPEGTGRDVPKENRLTLEELDDVEGMMLSAAAEAKEEKFSGKGKPIDTTGEPDASRGEWGGKDPIPG